MAEAEAPEVTPPKEGDLPQSSELDGSTPEEVATNPEEAQPPEVVPTEKVAAKKPRKPRQPKVATKLAAVAEGVAETAPAAQEAQLPLEFWAGLMQTQKVIMARRKSKRYNSFRIT